MPFDVETEPGHIICLSSSRCRGLVHLLEVHIITYGNPRGVRTSEGAFFTRDADPLFALVEDKISALTGIPVDHGEVRCTDGRHSPG